MNQRSANKRSGSDNLAERWRGAFGDAYVDRNAESETHVSQRVAAFRDIFKHLDAAPPQTILEVGCNVGINLRALRVVSDAVLSAIEPNKKARDLLIENEILDKGCLYDSTGADLPFADESFDMIFTSGVLIHIEPENLEATYREIHRASKRFILTLEYFSPHPEVISYHGHDNMLFKRDFGGLWLDMFNDLEPVANGFFWKRTTGLDNLNWWLFQKT